MFHTLFLCLLLCVCLYMFALGCLGPALHYCRPRCLCKKQTLFNEERQAASMLLSFTSSDNYSPSFCFPFISFPFAPSVFAHLDLLSPPLLFSLPFPPFFFPLPGPALSSFCQQGIGTVTLSHGTSPFSPYYLYKSLTVPAPMYFLKKIHIQLR